MAELVAVFDRRVKALTGGADSLGFIPAITWKELLSTWRMLHPSPESAPCDAAPRISTLGTWGPHVARNAANPYV